MIEGFKSTVARSFQLLKGLPIELIDPWADDLNEFADAEESQIAEGGQDLSVSHLNGGLDLGFIARLSRPTRENRQEVNSLRPSRLCGVTSNCRIDPTAALIQRGGMTTTNQKCGNSTENHTPKRRYLYELLNQITPGNRRRATARGADAGREITQNNLAATFIR